MNRSLRVLVTGAGSVVGQGIVKSLRLSALDCVCVAADIGPLNAGLYRADEAVSIPRVEAPDALSGITETIKAARADAVFLGSEFDLAFYAAHRDAIEDVTGATVLVSEPETIAIADDKFATGEFLANLGVPAPRGVAAATLDEALTAAADMGYPVIVKSRSGTSARGVFKVTDPDHLRGVWSGVGDAMVQEFLAPNPASDDGSGLGAEYTCAVFTDARCERHGPFVARRRLRGGSSWVIESRRRPDFDSALMAIAGALNSRGSINVQLMDTEDGPKPFELNARASGTTAVRAHFGFNEPEMALRSYVLGEALERPTIREGLCLRYEEEVFLDDVSAAGLATLETPPKGEVHRWF